MWKDRVEDRLVSIERRLLEISDQLAKLREEICSPKTRNPPKKKEFRG